MKNTLLLLLLATVLCAPLGAQQTGTASFGTSDSHTVDSIDLSTLSLTVNIPVLAKRGALPFSFGLQAKSSCTVTAPNDVYTMVCTTPAATANAVGLEGATAGYNSSVVQLGCTVYSQFYVQDATAMHPVAATNSLNGCNVGSFTAIAIDGSGYTLKASIALVGQTPTYQVWSAGGVYTPSTKNTPILFASETDTFGNAISTSGAVTTDTLGTAAITKITGGYQWTDTNGSLQAVTVTSGTPLTVNSGFCFNNDSGTLAPYTVGYPDGTSLSIGLEQGAGGVNTTTGRIGSITLRTGATISYAYGPLVCPTGGGPAYPSSLTRTDPDGTTTYTLTYNSSNSTYTNTVLDPGKNKTVYTFTGVPQGLLNSTNATTVTQIQRYQNTGTVASPVYMLLTTDLYCYQGSASNCPATTYQYPITQRDVYHTIGTATSRISEAFDGYGNRTSIARYDFGAASPTITTTITYGSWNGTQCVGVVSNIFNEPCDVVTSDGTHTLSESRYTYSSKGFKTTGKRWTGTAWLTSTYAPNTNGTAASSTDVSGLVTTYTYGCNNLLLTGATATVNGVVLGTGATWDCNGAVVLTTTGPSGNGTSATYDSMFRPLSSTDESGQTTNFSYTSNSLTTSLSFSNGLYSAATTETLGPLGRLHSTQTTDGSSYDTVTHTNGFIGPNWSVSGSIPCLAALGSDCSAGFTTSYVDPIGRPISSGDQNGGTSTWAYLGSGTKYDAQVTIGPAPTGEHVKQAQTEFDGLGRIKSTCALQTSGGTACGQAMGGSGVLTSNAYSFGAGTRTAVSTRGTQSRTIVKDALGRTISSTTPEAGTTTYVYDSYPSACGNQGFSGNSYDNLVSRSDAAGNLVCYQYDAIHRLTDTGNSTESATNPCKRFRYDNVANAINTTPPSGYTAANIAGRLMQVETDAPCTAQRVVLTDEWFSYDANGRLTDVWESTPHSGVYYHTNLTYWMNGAPNTLTGIPGYAAYSIALNSNGRPYSSMLGTLALVNKVNRNAAGQPTTIGFGAGSNQDTYTYDTNTGRMTTYTFAVGSATDVGTLTWSPNGTLDQLKIVDGINAGGSQTCNFAYDDIARLTADNCGSLWNQTYSYDQYDNLTKTGNPGTTWNPGYSATTNRITGASYGANGDVTYDLNNTYTWDAYGKMASARSGTSQAVCGSSGNCVTYDALGRAVEKTLGSVYFELLYSPLGLVATMSGATTVSSAQLPMPAGAIMQFSGAGGAARNVNHADWLGTVRLKTGITTGTVQIDTAYTPYGEVYDTFGSTANNEIFTGDQQNLFAGLFDTPNRELDQTSGSRWLSPDLSGSGWNAYAYGTNPNGASDRTGLYMCACEMNDTESDSSFGNLDPAAGGWTLSLFGGGAGAANGEPPPLRRRDPPFSINSRFFDVAQSALADSVSALEGSVAAFQQYMIVKIADLTNMSEQDVSVFSNLVMAETMTEPLAWGGTFKISVGATAAEAEAVEVQTVDRFISDGAGQTKLFEFAEQPSFREPNTFGRYLQWNSWKKPGSPLSGSKLGGKSVYQEGLNGSGEYRTSDHWEIGKDGAMTMDATPQQMLDLGGTPYENGTFWVFETMITGFFHY